MVRSGGLLDEVVEKGDQVLDLLRLEPYEIERPTWEIRREGSSTEERMMSRVSTL